ncbi:MAG: multiheme c-type cytochrome [Fimbriimonas sp.]
MARFGEHLKLVWGLFGLAGAVGGGLIQAADSHKPWPVVISGDTLGYLSPCGCTDPMSGGIRRRATVVRELGKDVLFVDSGSLTKDVGRQSEMKAETMAEALKSAGVDAINLTSLDAQLGRGSVLSIARLSGGKLIASQLPEGNELGLPRWLGEGPFLVGGVTTKPHALAASLGLQPKALEEAVAEFALEAISRTKTPVLLLEGGLEEARVLAKDYPSLRLIVYRTIGDPPAEPLREGDTLLVTPGDRGKSVLKLSFSDGAFQAYQPLSLGPEHADDRHVASIYSGYLKRVTSSSLLEQVPRTKGAPFAGTAACISCHGSAGKIWKKSAHAHALATLEKEGHSRDPDCVSCHVVGLSLTTGFRSRNATPQLADVGCESCHGTGGLHSKKPYLHKMAHVGDKACASCHTAENSPRFDFAAYWAKIRH